MCDILMNLNGQVFLKIMWFSAALQWNWSIPWSKPHIPNITNFDALVNILHFINII